MRESGLVGLAQVIIRCVRDGWSPRAGRFAAFVFIAVPLAILALIVLLIVQ